MTKIIEVDKTTGRTKLDEELKNLPQKNKIINLKKYFGKVNFGTDGMDYQLKVRNEWR